MNAEIIKQKLQSYYAKATPAQIVAEFQAMGVEFEEVLELKEIEVSVDKTSWSGFDSNEYSWKKDFLVKADEVFIIDEMESENLQTDSQKSTSLDAGNYQYAMAA